jgi:hypothetical protein
MKCGVKRIQGIGFGGIFVSKIVTKPGNQIIRIIGAWRQEQSLPAVGRAKV